MKDTGNKDIIPLVISILLVIVSIGLTLVTDDHLITYKHYTGAFLLVISTLLYFKKKSLYPYIFGLTLLLGLIDIIDFFYINTIFQIGPLCFNPIFLALLILFLALNKQFTKKLFPDNISR